jgi:hypothetical protein
MIREIGEDVEPLCRIDPQTDAAGLPRTSAAMADSGRARPRG